MNGRSRFFGGVGAIGVLLLAACSSAPDDAKTGADFATAKPNQELLVLPPMGAHHERATEPKDGLHEFAESISLLATPNTTGVWDSPSPGLRRWRFSVERAGSLSQNLGFTRYHMPRGGELRLLDGNGRRIATFTDKNNKAHGELWTPIVPGVRATVEVTIPAVLESSLDLALTQVSSAFRGFVPSFERSGSCNKDVACSEGEAWRDEIRSVAVISLGGSRMCTGQLLNDTSGDGRMFFLTARHCGVSASNASSLVVYWNYQTSTCGGSPDGSLSQFQTGSVWRAAGAPSDFTLVELDDLADPAFDLYWSGWDARTDAPSSAVAIHHPNCDEKRISFENDPLTITNYGGDASPGDGTHLRVADWDVGTTEPGSSGSGIWNAEHRLVGQLHGGRAACGNDLADWYGWFAKSFSGGSSSSERAKDWLDEANSGATFTDGKGGCARPTIDFTTSPNPAQVGGAVSGESTVSGGSPPYAYAWDMNGDGQTDCTGPACTFTYGQEFEGNVQLAVTDSTGCKGIVSHQQAVVDPSLCPKGFDSSDVPKSIPDDDESGVSSTLAIDASGSARNAKISLRIAHTYVGDLRVVLVAPSGKEIALHQNGGGAADDLVLNDVDLPGLNGENITGTWNLRAIDNANADTGQIVSWRLTFRTACSP